MPPQLPHTDLLTRARAGDSDSLGELLNSYRSYLLVLAQSQWHGGAAVDVSVSDVVQDCLLEAARDFNSFRGDSEPVLMAWLRRILANNLTDQLRRCGAVKQRLAADSIELAGRRLAIAASELSSPSTCATREEHAGLLAAALAELPEPYRQVIIARHLHRCSFEEIARELQRSSGAVRMLWLRAIERLRSSLQRVKDGSAEFRG